MLNIFVYKNNEENRKVKCFYVWKKKRHEEKICGRIKEFHQIKKMKSNWCRIRVENSSSYYSGRNVAFQNYHKMLVHSNVYQIDFSLDYGYSNAFCEGIFLPLTSLCVLLYSFYYTYNFWYRKNKRTSLCEKGQDEDNKKEQKCWRKAHKRYQNVLESFVNRILLNHFFSSL